MIKKTITQVLTTEHTPKREICGAWFRSGELALLYAGAGTGKSRIAMRIAYAVATGRPFIGFVPPRAARVVYVEAEMPERDIAQRLGEIEYHADVSAKPDHFKFMGRDEKGNLPNLGTHEGQVEYWQNWKDAEFIVIDNLTTIAPPVDGRDDDVKIWYRIKKFLYALRTADKCVLMIHHSGKSGQQLGTSIRQNDMDIILRLTSPTYQRDEDRLGMYIDIEKARSLPPSKTKPLFVQYETIDGAPIWTYRDGNDYRAEEIRRLGQRMRNKMAIAAMLDCPQWYVHKVLSESEEECNQPKGKDHYGDEDDDAMF